MILEVLISTCNDGIFEIENLILDPHDGIRYLVVHQIFENDDRLYTDTVASLAKRSDVRIIPSRSRGLSKSRNLAIAEAKGDILLIADDDGHYRLEGLLGVLSAFKEAPSADIITFKISTPEGGDYKRYSSRAFVHGRFSIFRVSSLEIALRSSSLKGRTNWFDEKFGLGASYPACEETVFLSDLLKNGKILHFVPLHIVTHGATSSGNSWGSIQAMIVRGALFRRVQGLTGLPFLIVFSIKHWIVQRHRYSFRTFVGNSLRGFFTYNQ